MVGGRCVHPAATGRAHSGPLDPSQAPASARPAPTTSNAAVGSRSPVMPKCTSRAGPSSISHLRGGRRAAAETQARDNGPIDGASSIENTQRKAGLCGGGRAAVHIVFGRPPHHICFPLRLAATSVRPASACCSCCGKMSLITSAARGHGIGGGHSWLGAGVARQGKGRSAHPRSLTAAKGRTLHRPPQ